MRIGIAGAPGSGKTTFAALLYTELLAQGNQGAFLIHEYAKEWLANGNELKTFMDQIHVSNEQISRELKASKSTFSPIICDSCIWLGGIYTSLMDYPQTSLVKSLITNVETFDYDMTIFIPLPDSEDKLSKFRIHNAKQSEHIEDLILDICSNKGKNVWYAPSKLEDRYRFIKDIIKEIRC